MSGESREAIDIRHALVQLLWLEGRLVEASELIETNWYSNFNELGPLDGATLANLRAHLSLDFEVYPIDHVRKRLQGLAQKQAEDIGLKLAMVNLMLRNGETGQADQLFKTITAAGFSELQNAITRTELELDLQKSARISLTDEKHKNLSVDLPTAVSLISRVQGPQFHSPGFRDLLVRSLKFHPASIETIETLSEQLIFSGSPDLAFKLRNDRKALDQTRRDYANLVGSDLRRNPEKMAIMAAQLGRWFEAFAFSTMIKNPSGKLTPELKSGHEYQDLARESSKKFNISKILADIGLPSDSGMPLTITDANKNEIKLAIPQFEDVTTASGINFLFDSGRTPQRQLPETMSGGLAVIDFDHDGLMDLLLLQGGPFPHLPKTESSRPGDRLFRNLGDGRFADVTTQAGLPAQSIGYSHGVTVGDINNDTYDDILITRFGGYQLFVNTGKATFVDQTEKWGLSGRRDWPTSAAFTDFDNDGDLDLYVCHYVVWDPANPRLCGTEAGGPIQYCVPHLLTARPDHLFRNDGGHFTDVSDSSGVTAADTDGRGLGVVTADFNRDGLMDIFVANDGTANFLFINRGNFQFTNEAFASGVAANSDGGFQAGMGVACGDFNNDLLPDIVVTNFYGESTSYFENLGQGLFRERSATTGLKEATRYRLGFGTALADFNNDGQLDLFTANGHVNDVRPVIPYQMPPQLFLGSNGRSFIDSGARSGRVFQASLLGRGLAILDFNNDGLIDAAQINLDESLSLMKNNGLADQSLNNSITLKLTGTKSSR
ncbi:MAG: FG-GAP repeat domain-containing protein, partial [bacterium]